MASPTLETVCCAYNEHHPSVESILHFDIISYNIVCLISGCLGIIGAIYQILPYVEHGHLRRFHFSSIRQRSLIKWLALADLMASAGILIRSVTWISDGMKLPMFSDSGNVFCALISVWIHFFYCATYFWTIIYAVDVYFTTKRKMSFPIIYHGLCWGLSLVFTGGGMITLYVPNMRCHMEFKSVLANYLLTYCPIFIAMIINPIFYTLASQEFKILLTTSGQFSDQERIALKKSKEKFFFIVFVFHCCWLPNIVNGIVLWAMWGNLPRNFLISLWYMMAVLNPLQAFLNSLVYRGWDSCGKTLRILCCPVIEEAERTPDSETTPALASTSSCSSICSSE